MVRPVLSQRQAEIIVTAGQAGQDRFSVSLDLGRSQSQVSIIPVGAVLVA